MTDFRSMGIGRRRRRPRSIAALLGGLMAFIGVVGGTVGTATAGAASAQPLKVAIIADETGVLSSFGMGGGQLAGLKTINSQGGIDGTKIVISSYDSQSTPSGLQTAIQQALSGHPNAILLGNPTFGGPNALLAQAGIPVFSIEGNPDVFNGQVSPWFYGVTTSAQQLVSYFFSATKLALGKTSLKGQRIALEGYDAPEVVTTFAIMKKEAAKLGAKFVAFDLTSASGLVSFASQAAQIVQDKPTVVWDNDIASNATIAIQAMSAAGIKVPFVASEATGASVVFSRLKLKNFYASRTSEEVDPGTALYDIASKYGLTSQTSGSYFASGFATAYVLKDVLAKCGSNCTVSRAQSAAVKLGKIQIPDNALYAPVVYTASSRPGITAEELYRWNGSKAVPFKLVNIANSIAQNIANA
jgi:ABC-type branched-subunit amino acid transport system substrate-binding protein